MKKFILDLTVNSVEALSDKHVLIKLTDDKPLPEMLPGQFVEVRVDNSPSTFLRRPISINNVDYDRNELWLLVAAVGDGTRQLQKLQKGDRLNCMLPLGNSFTMPTDSAQKVLLVGGGVGVAPLLYFGKRIKAMGGEPTFLLGARSAKDVLERELFKQVGRVFITTEDGSEGEKGFVTNHSVLAQEHFDRISLRTEADDDGCGSLRLQERHRVRGIAREQDGVWRRSMSLLRREDSGRQQVCM